MTASRHWAWASPVIAASVGTAVAGAGLLCSHLAFYFAVPGVILVLRLIDDAGLLPSLSYPASLVLLAVLSPLVFACYGAAVVAPRRIRTRAIVAAGILIASAVASATLTL